jgi:hypothetical protein
MLHNYKLGCISASQTIVITGIFLLIWAFGSYLIYVLTVPDPFVCFPPFSGCVSISHAGIFAQLVISLNLVLAGLSLGLKNRQVGEKWVFDDCSYLGKGL